MADADAGMNQPLAFPFAIPGIDVVGADLEFQRRGDTIEGLIPLVFRVLSVSVQVNEP